MNIDNSTSTDVNILGVPKAPSCVGHRPSTPSSVQSSNYVAVSEIGVSTKSTLSKSAKKSDSRENMAHWYALRATYGRELKAYNYLISKGITAFCPVINVTRKNNGKCHTYTVSRLPNILFAYGTEKQLKMFVYNNIDLSYLRFYCEHKHNGHKIENAPLVIPDSQMESLKIICQAGSNDVIMSPTAISKFKLEQVVRITDGPFCGVSGVVARYKGQQRVAVVISNFLTACTAYIPKAFIELA